jgi:hypothetical protein
MLLLCFIHQAYFPKKFGVHYLEVMIAAAARDNVRILAVDTSDDACKKAQPRGMGWNLKGGKRAGAKQWSRQPE